MSRLPHENRNVRGVEGPKYEMEEVCAHPSCDVRGRDSLEIHHLWPRSFLRGQPIEYVQLWDGTVIGNQVFLCGPWRANHHGRITENKALIEYHLGEFYWFDDPDEDGVPLSPQPPLYGSEKPQEGKRPSDEETPTAGSPAGLDVLTRTYGHALYGDPDSDGSINVVYGLTEAQRVYEEQTCPKCKGTGKKPPEQEKKKEKARNRVSKSIRVPKDEQENGVEILEDMIEQVEEVLRPGEKPRAPYYTLVDALGLCIVNKDVIL